MNGTGVIGLEGQTPPKRQIFPQEWEVRTIVPGSVNSELLLPEMPVVHGGAVTIFDFGDFTIKSFRISDGRLLWRYGRQGSGPRRIPRPDGYACGFCGDVVDRR